MERKIEHTGFITQIIENKVTVQIVQQSACSACYAKVACNASESKNKAVVVQVTDKTYKVGEQVRVIGKLHHGLLAVLLAFVIPFFLVLLVLIIARSLCVEDVMAAFISLIMLIPYYLFIALLNNKLASKLKFSIEKINH